MDTLIKEAADELAKCYDGTGNVVFPQYTNGKHQGKKRVSEQEARIIFSVLLNQRMRPFSIEAPTPSTFSFTPGAKSKRSANHDMVIYKNDKSTFDWVIELKAHNVAQRSIDKDFEKMMLSDSNCVWFHIFENADCDTFTDVLSKFDTAIKNHFKKHAGKHLWKIVLIVLNQERKLYFRDIHLTNNKYTNFNHINLFENIVYGT